MDAVKHLLNAGITNLCIRSDFDEKQPYSGGDFSSNYLTNMLIILTRADWLSQCPDIQMQMDRARQLFDRGNAFSLINFDVALERSDLNRFGNDADTIWASLSGKYTSRGRPFSNCLAIPASLGIEGRDLELNDIAPGLRIAGISDPEEKAAEVIRLFKGFHGQVIQPSLKVREKVRSRKIFVGNTRNVSLTIAKIALKAPVVLVFLSLFILKKVLYDLPVFLISSLFGRGGRPPGGGISSGGGPSEMSDLSSSGSGGIDLHKIDWHKKY
jgi:hypothetical protein